MLNNDKNEQLIWSVVQKRRDTRLCIGNDVYYVQTSVQTKFT